MTACSSGATASPREEARVRRHALRVLLILSALMGFGSISTDLYLPALPIIAHALHARPGAAELTIAGYLIGFSLGQLLWGPIGDRHGRRMPVAAGLVLFVIGSAGCALSATIGAMIAWRIVQAAGACAGVVLARAMVRDLYDRDRAAQMLSTLITVMAVAPLAGPLVGGQILAVASWRMIFWVLVGVGIATLAALFTLPETLPPERRSAEPLMRAFAAYGTLLRDRALLGYAGTGGLFYVGIYAYIAGTPFAYIRYYGVAPQRYGLLFASAIGGIMAANLVNARLVGRFGSEPILRTGTLAAASAGMAAAIAVSTGWGGLAALAVTLFAYCAASGLIVANAIAGALGRFPERTGTASALVGAVQYGMGILGSTAVGLLADGTPRPLGWLVAAGGIGSLACAHLLVRDKSGVGS